MTITELGMLIYKRTGFIVPDYVLEEILKLKKESKL